ncbi:Hypothetical protein SRAE_2000318500 [Strongyloides ratti]|uniref:Uncharacterized protein n=1 Tax=Strongyloides ratti TaxID=34506 RepID=A0A090LK56_STRRB|nr:Hypothetical protein SRAE_2000318500 [Strongyloides ratti]CEF68528.1 Hypothetical protein SRAE_2000318500 [Strongyloides ratti]
MTTSSDILVKLAQENSTYEVENNSTNVDNKNLQTSEISTYSSIFKNLNYSENNILSLNSPILSVSPTIFSKEQSTIDYDISTSITAEELHSLIIQGDKVLADNFLRLFMQSPILTENLSRILIKNTEVAMERLKLMQLNNERSLSNYSSGFSTPISGQTIFEQSQCNSPSIEIEPSITSDTSSEMSLYEEAVNEVLMESTTQVTQHEYEAILGMLQLKNSSN